MAAISADGSRLDPTPDSNPDEVVIVGGGTGDERPFAPPGT